MTTSWKNNQFHRVASCVLCAWMVFVVLFSAFFLTAELGHECHEEDCPICACMQFCDNTLHQMGGVDDLSSAVVSWAVVATVAVAALILFIRPITLCSQKIRLNN
ncbi:MAG: hypothetical protein K6A05_08530 [Lachnospiraceae bacterium]|nr:hypothetical protein [Lachnospiraceae bacterium]